jgi:hypothetical protein
MRQWVLIQTHECALDCWEADGLTSSATGSCSFSSSQGPVNLALP